MLEKWHLHWKHDKSACSSSLHFCLLFWFQEFQFCKYSWWVANRLKELCCKPICLPTWVVFDGEIWVVEHLWDKAIVEEVALDRVVSIHRADNLDNLCDTREVM